MKKKIYLASPFFTPEQIAKRDEVYNLIKSKGFPMFSPGHDNLIQAHADDNVVKSGFQRNLMEIDNADILLAIGNGYDTGTMIEIGYALKAGVPVIYFNDSNDGKNRNLMIAGASLMYARTIDVLDVMLSIIDNGSEMIE